MEDAVRYSSWFVLIVAVFVTCLITANIIAVQKTSPCWLGCRVHTGDWCLFF